MKKQLIAAAAIGGALLGGSLSGAGAANAYGFTELTYLQTLNNYGFYITDTAGALSTGYRVCNQFSYMDGNAIARDVFVNTTWAETSSLNAAARIVNAAANTLCPWVWSNGSISSQYL